MNVNGRNCRCRVVRVVRVRRLVIGGDCMALNGAAERSEGIKQRNDAARQRACGEEQQSKVAEGAMSDTISYSTI